jgi:hypothetical protein
LAKAVTNPGLWIGRWLERSGFSDLFLSKI